MIVDQFINTSYKSQNQGYHLKQILFDNTRLLGAYKSDGLMELIPNSNLAFVIIS